MDGKVFIPEIQYTTDNAAMIGIVGYLKYINLDISGSKSTPLAKYITFNESILFKF